MIDEILKKNNCNELHIQYDKESGCFFIIAMNTTYANKANGGTRMIDYRTFTEGIEDAIKLVNVMTKKCIIISKKYNGGYSGGKGVIIGNPSKQKTPNMLRRFGKFVQSLNGRFQTGTDMNISLKDINHMNEESQFIDGLESGLGDTAIPTAHGIIVAMKILSKWKYGGDSLKNKTIAVQGLGSVGSDIVKRLSNEGANLIVTDIDKKKVNTIIKKYKVKFVKPKEIYKVKCDIFSPNACGGCLTKENIEKLDCDIIMGAANNPLSDENSLIYINKKRIIYVPDYVINIGGVFLSMCEVQGKDFDYVIKKLTEIITRRLKQIISLSEKDQISLYEAAERLINNEIKK